MMLNNLLDATSNDGIAGINEEVVKQHWNNIIEEQVLGEDETIRLVVMPSKESKFFEKANMSKGTGAFTDTTQIRSCEQLIAKMRQYNVGEIEGMMGFALSAGIYAHQPKTAPNINQLRRIKNLIIDIDARHKQDPKAERFNLTILDPKYIKYASITVLNYINQLLLYNGIPAVTPKFANCTGGGFQFGISFNEVLDKDTSIKVFNTFGSILGTLKDSKSDGVQQKIAEKADQISVSSSAEQSSLMKTKGVNVQVKTSLGEWFMPFLEIDNSFKDASHAQRIVGTINQKYGVYSYTDNQLVKDGNYYKQVIEPIKQDIYSIPNLDDVAKQKLIEHYVSTYTMFNNTVIAKNPECKYSIIDAKSIVQLAPIIQTANTNARHEGVSYINLSEIEKQILKELDKNRVIGVLEDLGIKIVKDTGNYIACRSPFREDNNPSFAVYVNHDRAQIKDFADDKTYNLITLWMAINDCSKSDAIEQMAFKYGIKLDKADKKEFAKLQTAETALEYIQQVNVKDYIYYRLANKARSCTIKNVRTSQEATFDGSKVLSDHILINQLGVKHPDKEFRDEFWHLFEQYILIDAFEIFEPGSDKTIIDDHIRKVNIWTANESYLNCWAEAEKLQEMEIADAIKLIKETCPAIYLYLLQITQKGSLEFFINWLTCLAHFKYVSNIPIFPSIEGAGKNFFIKHVIAPYINSAYITIASGPQMQSNFNAFMAQTNLIVADEGDFTGTKDFDQLKLFTGNDTLRVEKKGVDSVQMPRKFNICMFTNGEVPIRHTLTDRRCNYFKLEHKLTKTLDKMGYKSVDSFRVQLDKEVHQFWGIIIKTKSKKEWEHNNLQNGIYRHQILLMHPFGKLVIKILENDWDSISLQLNERQKETQDEKINIALLTEIRTNFFLGKPIPLILINKYLDAMSWRSSISIQQFISSNDLDKHGIKIVVDPDSIKIALDVEKLQKWIYQENNLVDLIPEFAVKQAKTLEELKTEYEKKNSTSIVGSAPKATLAAPGMAAGIPPAITPTGLPACVPTGLPAGVPTGIPTP